MHRIIPFFTIFAVSILFFMIAPSAHAQKGCEGTKVTIAGAEKKLVATGAYPSSGRPGRCMTPKYIILHTTAGGQQTAAEVQQFFSDGGGGRGVASQFAVGKKGDIVQMVEMFDKKAEVANHIANYNGYAIGIEIAEQDVYNNKGEVPKEQYDAILKLVNELMSKYNIPKGDKGADWKAKSDQYENPPPGVYGHYQLNPSNRTDPGKGFLADILKEISGTGGGGTGSATACFFTKIGDPKGDKPELPAECQDSSGLGVECKEKPKDYPKDLTSAIKDKFNVTLKSFGADQTKWVWEKLHCTASTKFNDHIKGAVIQGKPAGGGYSRQVGCPPNTTVELKQYTDEAYFKFIITHELGHAVRNCLSRNAAKYNEHLNAIKKEGAISYYGGHAAACTGSDNASEDYADTVAYFLNPQSGHTSGPCGPKEPPNPYYKAEKKMTEHLTKVAEPVLKK